MCIYINTMANWIELIYIFIFINDWSIYWFSSIDKSIRFGRSVGRAILWPHGVISFVHSFFVFTCCVCVFFTLFLVDLLLLAFSSFVRFKSNSNSSPFLASSIFYLLEQVNFYFITISIFMFWFRFYCCCYCRGCY